jgi:hypothetical protein
MSLFEPTGFLFEQIVRRFDLTGFLFDRIHRLIDEIDRLIEGSDAFADVGRGFQERKSASRHIGPFRTILAIGKS